MLEQMSFTVTFNTILANPLKLKALKFTETIIKHTMVIIKYNLIELGFNVVSEFNEI